LKAVEPLSQDEDFWDKNKRLNRPMSPHLTIYKFQVTSVLSVSHRATGLALSGLMSGFAITMLALPHGFPHYYQLLTSCGAGLTGIFAAKFILAFPFIFHFANGIRHLVWDMGKGFQLNELYASGYTVVGLSLLLSLAAAAM
jgi:succinate dehydrogenase (ubiquinone) cytochrome b560 subunit